MNRTPLHYAASNPDVRVMEYLLYSAGYLNYINTPDAKGITVLIKAAENQNLGVMLLLIELGADCEYKFYGLNVVDSLQALKRFDLVEKIQHAIAEKKNNQSSCIIHLANTPINLIENRSNSRPLSLSNKDSQNGTYQTTPSAAPKSPRSESSW